MAISTTTPRILVVHPGERLIFAERDRSLLQSRYPTETYGFTSIHHLPKLRSSMNRADIVIFWFVGRAAYFGMCPPPRGPKIISLVGGYEAARLPEFNYGSVRSFWRRRIVKYILAHSQRIIAVSQYTQSELENHYNIPRDDITVIHNAVDTEYFIPSPTAPSSNSVFTTAYVSRVNIRKKGFDLLVETARRMPNIQFVVAGGLNDQAARDFAATAPGNVNFIGEISQPELLRYLQSVSVYFHPSRHESFGVSVIEAMSCGCVPVVSPYGALPEVVGNAGFILDRLDPDHAAGVLRQALAAPVEARQRARARVVEKFDTSIRAHKLYCLIDELMAGP